MSEEFQTIEELYQRVLPALQTKVHEFSLLGSNISERDLWMYFKGKWKASKNLTLYDIVHDIMSLELSAIEDKYNR